MRATQILSAEHRVIEQVLACLEKLAAAASQRGELDRQSIGHAIEFVQQFADGCHHAKEETHLFAAMAKRGFSREDGPVAVMLAEHETGRDCVRRMKAALDGGAPADFAAAAESYVRLLRDHIGKEEHCLFPMADQCLTAADQEALRGDFQAVERSPERAGTHERMLGIARTLADRLGVPAIDPGAGAGGCCGH